MSNQARQITVRAISVDGGGFVENKAIAEGTSVADYVQAHHGDPARYVIRVNNQPAAAGDELENGDTIAVAPAKTSGAK